MAKTLSEQYKITNIDDVETRIARRKNMSSVKADAIMKADADKREKYFFNQVADMQEVWTVWDDDVIPIYMGEKAENIRVWPDEIFAKNCHFESIDNPVITPIPIDDFLDKILQNEPGVELAIFPLRNEGLCKISPLDYFATRLSNEIARYQLPPQLY